MAQAKQGDTVKVHYTGKLDDGTVFDTSDNRDPLQFTVGAGQVIPGFEEAVIGMSVNETKRARFSMEEAYGPRREDLVLVVEKAQFPPDIAPQVGQQLRLHQANNEAITAVVTDVSEEGVTLDANHPLAGEALTFEVKLVEIA
ncbi:MAG: peptidylprolyl isomerase [Chloroflexi bacterium]|nr:peptidylprolyl isomerase [Chloroflexota bacterium]